MKPTMFSPITFVKAPSAVHWQDLAYCLIRLSWITVDTCNQFEGVFGQLSLNLIQFWYKFINYWFIFYYAFLISVPLTMHCLILSCNKISFKRKCLLPDSVLKFAFFICKTYKDTCIKDKGFHFCCWLFDENEKELPSLSLLAEYNLPVALSNDIGNRWFPVFISFSRLSHHFEISRN